MCRKKMVALVGVKDLVVVETEDALLIVDRHRAQNVSDIVKALERAKREELFMKQYASYPENGY